MSSLPPRRTDSDTERYQAQSPVEANFDSGTEQWVQLSNSIKLFPANGNEINSPCKWDRVRTYWCIKLVKYFRGGGCYERSLIISCNTGSGVGCAEIFGWGECRKHRIVRAHLVYQPESERFHLQTKRIRDLQTLNSYITLVRGVKSCMAVIMFEAFSPFDNVLATTIGNGIDFEANPGL